MKSIKSNAVIQPHSSVFPLVLKSIAKLGVIENSGFDTIYITSYNHKTGS